MIQAIHPLQIEIFERLRTADAGELRYSQMCPEGIETDVFNYHVKQLVKQGRIAKKGVQYALTAAGKELLSDLHPLHRGQTQRFKIAAMCLVLREYDPGQYKVLYQRRGVEPHKGSQALVAGGVKRGEHLLDAARRRLREEAGLESDPVWVGTLRKIRSLHADDAPWSDITYQVCVSIVGSGDATATKYGTATWISLPEAAKLEREQGVGSAYMSQLFIAIEKDITVLEKGFYVEERAEGPVW